MGWSDRLAIHALPNGAAEGLTRLRRHTILVLMEGGCQHIDKTMYLEERGVNVPHDLAINSIYFGSGRGAWLQRPLYTYAEET
jgi:hypothetical protein